MAVIKPYKGPEPYIFVSYAHKDMDKALEIIGRLVPEGYRVWYDEGIDPGTEWDEYIAGHIKGCGMFFALMSKNYLLSENCKDELNYARDLGKPRLLIYLEDVALPEGMRMRLNRLQAVHMYTYDDPRLFYDKLFETRGIENCRKTEDPDPVPKDREDICPVCHSGLDYKVEKGKTNTAVRVECAECGCSSYSTWPTQKWALNMNVIRDIELENFIAARKKASGKKGEIFRSLCNTWGPARDTFTNKSPADYVTFNSITDNAGVGDERNFVRIRKASSKDSYSDHVSVIPGEELIVYIYFQNDARPSLTKSGEGIARGTRIRAGLTRWQVNKKQKVRVSSTVSADNAQPKEVWDDCCITTECDQEVILKYVPETAVLHTSGKTNGTILKDTDLFGKTGALIGIDSLDGDIPSDENGSGHITFRLKASLAE